MKKFATGLVALCVAVIGCDAPKAPAPSGPVMTAPAMGGAASAAKKEEGEKKTEATEPAKMEAAEPAKTEATEPAKTETPAEGDKKEEEKPKEEAK